MYGRTWQQRQKRFDSKRVCIYVTLALGILFFIWYMNGEQIKYLLIRNANWTRNCVPKAFLDNPNPSVAIIMSYETSYYAELGKIAEDDKREYASKHGYDVFVNYEILDPTRKPSWFKVLMAQKYLPKYDWLFYVDADTIIMEHDTPLTKFIDDRYDIVFTNDHRGINAGVWMMKNTKWGNDFLQTWYVQGQEFLDERGINASHPFGKSGDQDTLEILMEEEENFKHAKVLPQCAFNSYPYWRGIYDGVYMKGDFLVHLAGKGTPPIRAKMFKAFQNHQYYHVISSNKTKHD